MVDSRNTTGRVNAHRIPMSRIVATPSVSANPRTGPTARKYRMTAAANVTVLPARLVRKADWNARWTAVRTVLPSRTSSRMRSKNRIDESAVIPMDTTIPAMPASVRVNPNPPIRPMSPVITTPKTVRALMATTPSQR